MSAAARGCAVLVSAAIASTAWILMRAAGLPNGYRLAEPRLDFKWVVWGPVRGVLRGYNVYDDKSGYVSALHVGGPATAHMPSSLTVLGPFAVPPLFAGWLVFLVATSLCIWISLWLLARPISMRDHIVVAAFGALLVGGGYGEFLMVLGDPTGFTLLGLALLFRFGDTGRGALGVLLLSFVPQTALPMSVLLARGRGRALAVGWGSSILLSAPALAVAWHDEGLGRLVRSLLDTVPSVTGNANRVDVVGTLLHHETVVSFAALLIAIAFVLCTGWEVGPLDLRRLLVATTVTTVVWYHEPYDLVLLGAVVGATLIRASRLRDRVPGGLFAIASVATSGLIIGAVADAWGSAAPAVWRLITNLMVVALIAAVATPWIADRSPGQPPKRVGG